MHDFIYKMCVEDGRKTPKWKKRKTNKTEEKFPVCLLSHSRFYDTEADCFLVSENTENKPAYV